MARNIISPRTMKGVMELLPGEQVAFQRMMDTIRRGFERFGFLPISTPVLEYIDILLTKSGGETEKQVYFAQSTGSRAQGYDPKLAMRFDLTVPLARYVAEHEYQLHFPFRRYQIQKVYRGEAAQRGRYREFYQCDIDVIGRETLGIAFDAEIPAIIAQIFAELEVGSFTIGINNRKLLAGFYEGLGIADPTTRRDVLREVDKLDKVGPKGVRAALAREPLSLADDTINRILEFAALEGDNATILAALGDLGVDSPLFAEGRAELAEVIGLLGDYDLPEGCFRINLSIARGLDYYTGTVYETLLDAHPEIGSVCSGGRYDDLASYYTKSRLPGVGISIGLTRLFSQLQALGLVKTATTPTQVLVCRQDPALASQYTRIATRLRAAGIPTEVVLQDGNLKKQLKLAVRRTVPLVIIMGSGEAEAGVVNLKDMQAKTQTEVPIDGLVDAVRAALER